MSARKSVRRSATPSSGDEPSVDDLFLPWKKSAPLAARMRPRTLGEYVGQEHVLGPGKLLRRAIEADRVSSIILWGPPGSGKTTLARVIAGATRSHFETLNAVLAGVKDIREVVARARERLAREPDLLETPRRTTLFVDEVHRFNKAQQDALLPHVENGTIAFIGATTENPYFEVIKALVSRSRIFELRPLTPEHLERIARSALEDRQRGYGELAVKLEPDALEHLVDVANGDARNLLNALELAVETTPPSASGPRGEPSIVIDQQVAEESIQRRALLYDKDGDAHYDTISAFIKSLRGSDPDAALFWLAKMVRAGEDPRFIARRLVIFASEDVGMADPNALSVASAAAHAVEFVGLPECQWNLSQAVIYLATAPKSNSAIAYFDAVKRLEEGGDDAVPDPLKDASRDREGLGHGVGYKYPHAYREHWVAQQYLPDGLQGMRFYEPGEQGFEAGVKRRVEDLRARQDDGVFTERRLEEIASGRARRLKTQIEVHGEARVRFRERLLEKAQIEARSRVLDLGERPGLLGWGALERAGLGRVTILASSSAELERLRAEARAEAVDLLLEPALGDLESLPLEDASFDRVVGSSILYARADRAEILAECARVLAPGGRIALFEPFLARSRPISHELDLRPLGEALAERVREAEKAVYSAPDDPRMKLDLELLECAFRELGLETIAAEPTLETVQLQVTSAVLVQWFSGGGGPTSYESRLASSLSADELAAYRRLLEEQLIGRNLHRPVHGGIVMAAKQ